MDQKTLLDRVSTAANIERGDCETLVAALTDIIGNTCANLDSVAIPGFGSIEGVKRNECITTDPVTERRVLTPPRIVLSFRPSAVLKQKIR